MYTIIKMSIGKYCLWINGTSGNSFDAKTFETKKDAIKFCKANKLKYK